MFPSKCMSVDALSVIYSDSDARSPQEAFLVRRTPQKMDQFNILSSHAFFVDKQIKPLFVAKTTSISNYTHRHTHGLYLHKGILISYQSLFEFVAVKHNVLIPVTDLFLHITRNLLDFNQCPPGNRVSSCHALNINTVSLHTVSSFEGQGIDES